MTLPIGRWNIYFHMNTSDMKQFQNEKIKRVAKDGIVGSFILIVYNREDREFSLKELSQVSSSITARMCNKGSVFINRSTKNVL